MTAMSLKLPDDLAARLDAAAAKRGVSRSAFLRDVLESHLKKDDVPGSVADLAGDLVGCLRGASDLSSNASHLEGFGE